MSATATATAPAYEIRTGQQLIRSLVLTVQPLTREAFAPYGEVIGERGHIELDLDDGHASVAAQTVEARPLSFDFLGRHLRTEQVFVPLGGAASIIAVAPPSPANAALPEVKRLAAFLVDGSCAFKLHRGAWHTSAFPLGERAAFLVVDREGTLEEDYDLRDLKTALGIVVEIQMTENE
jgi:ureidoglycolate lyase